MTTPGSRPRKGFLAGLSAAMTPQVPEDDGAPIRRPTAINVAVGLTVLGALIFLFFGGASLLSAQTQVNLAANQYGQAVQQCVAQAGGIGTQVPSSLASTPTPASTDLIGGGDLVKTCQGFTATSLTADQISSFKTSVTLFSLLIVLVGVGSAVAGWFLRNGARWARRVLIGAAVVALALAGLFQISNSFTLLATLLLVIGLLLCYIGKGGLYYSRLALRRRQARH